MAEEIKTEEKAEVKQEIEQPKPEVDLVTRVSQVKAEVKKEEKSEEGKFNINDLDAQIESIQDANLKNQFIEFKKSLLRGENQKYQEIANLRKQYEQKLAEVTTWTPDRIKQEMAKPDFVQAANVILQNQDKQNEYSGLTDAEKREIEQARQAALNAQVQLYQLQRNQVHSKLQQKYANYNPNVVEEDIKQLFNGRIPDETFIEAIWKSRDYEQGIKRAYDLGAQDKVNLNKERVAGMTSDSGNNMPKPETIERQKGETVQQFILRSYAEHAKKK